MSQTFVNPLEYFYHQLSMNLLGGDVCIDIPKDYHSRVKLIKNHILDEDRSGMVASILDFMIETATVDYRISTNNGSLTKILNDWKKSINEDMIEQVPSGMKALANQYFRERWSSSMLALNVSWKEDDKLGIILPDKMWFTDSQQLYVEGNGSVLGSYKYSIGNPQDKNKKDLPLANTTFFVRKDKSQWYDKYPSPYLVKRGTAYHWRFKKILVEKQFDVLRSIMLYMLWAKKGDPALIASGKQTIKPKELEELKEKLQELKGSSNTRSGPNGLVAATPFDTQFEHFMPDLTKIFNESIIAPTDRNILASLGLIEIVEGISTSRKDAILNPKPLVEEIKAGVRDFRDLMADVLTAARKKNQISHPKYWTNTKIEIVPFPVKAFIDDSMRVMIRSWYDRGIVSKSDAVQSTTDLDFTFQIEERILEENSGVDDLMVPPPIMFVPGQSEDPMIPEKTVSPEDNTDTPEQRTSQPDFEISELSDINCENCGQGLNYADYPEARMGVIKCPRCEKLIDQTGKSYVAKNKKNYLQAPYDRNSDLPKSVKALPSEAQTIWRKTFNSVFDTNKDLPKDQREGKSTRIAWSVVRKQYEQNADGEWVKKESK